MCTLALAYRVFPEAPIAVAANRDELVGRPSAPPAVLRESPRIVAPLDEAAGGTWIGYNGSGILVAITNRWVDGLEGERSRGRLVRDALGAETAATAVRIVERELDARSYEGFNLVVAGADDAVLLEWDGRLRVTEFDPGVHVVMNAGHDDRFDAGAGPADRVTEQADSARRVRVELEPAAGESAQEWLDRAASILGDHDYGVCVHEGEFGTRSSSLIALPADGPATYRFADGPPCRTAFEDVQL